jgi:hypothetical protein
MYFRPSWTALTHVFFFFFKNVNISSLFGTSPDRYLTSGKIRDICLLFAYLLLIFTNVIQHRGLCWLLIMSAVKMLIKDRATLPQQMNLQKRSPLAVAERSVSLYSFY